MIRFTAIALACLLAVSARAAECPVPKIYAEYDNDLNCIALRCMGMRLLREAYQRGEISTVHLSRKSECSALSSFDPATGRIVAVPCTWDQDDYYRPF